MISILHVRTAIQRTNLSIHEKNTMTNMNDRGNGNQLLLQYQKKKYCSNMCCCTIS